MLWAICILLAGLASSASHVAQAALPAAILVDATPLGQQSAKSLDLTKLAIHAQALLPSRNGIHFYRLRYNTVDPTGRPQVASGLLILPDGQPLIPVVSYQHGTYFGRTESPSSSTTFPETMAAAVAFASMGYGVIAADYLGQGSNVGQQPYLNAGSEAQVVTDLLLAAHEYCKTQGVAWNGELDLVGYSEGAHATMATQRALESAPRRALLPPVAATVVGAGPYDLSGVTFAAALEADSAIWTASTADVIYALSSYYPVATSLEEIFRAPYVKTVPALLDGSHASEAVVAAFPPRLADILAPDFYAGVQTDPTHPLRLALAANDVYNWKPRAPILFLHASGDSRVPYANSTKILNAMRARGANVSLEDLGATLDHDEAFIPAMLRAAQWLGK